MRKLTKATALILTLVLIIGALAGCKKTPTKQQSKKIGMIVSTLNNPFFVSMKEGAEKKAKELGLEIVVIDSQNDPAKERSNVEDLVQQNVAVLIINPTDSDAVANSIQVAKDANIPVITVDRQANGVEVASHIASDNAAGGKMAGDFILSTLGGKANIVELQGIPGASATRDRGKGFHEAVDNKAGVKVVSSQAADFDRQKGLNVMENVIQSTPNFDAIFAHNDEMALGAVKALKTAGKKAVVVGFDGTADAVTAVNNGEMAATIAQQPDLMGSLAAETASKIMKGETVAKQIPVELKVIKK